MKTRTRDEPMHWTRSFRSVCRKCGCSCVACLNGALAILAAGLVGIILLNAFQQVIPAPNQAVKSLLQSRLDPRYQADWQSLVLDLQGGFLLQDFSLREQGSDHPLLSAEAVRVDLDPLALLTGNPLPLDEIEATGLTVFLPPGFSPSGLPEPAVRILDARLVLQQDRLLLQHAILQSDDATLLLSGSFPLRDQPLQGQTADWPEHLPDPVRILARLGDLPDHQSLTGRLHWAPDSEGRLAASATFTLAALQHSQARLGNLFIHAAFNLQNGRPVVSRLQGNGRITAFDPTPFLPAHVPVELKLPIRFSFSATGPPASAGPLAVPETFQATLLDPLQRPFPAHALSLQATAPFQPARIHAVLSAPAGFLSAEARIQPPESQSPFPVSLDLQASLHNPRLTDFFAHLPEVRLLEDAHTRTLRLQLHSPDHPGGPWSGLLVTDQLHIGQTDFAHVHSPFSFHRGQLHFQPVHVVKTHGQSARGSYTHHLPSSRFSLNAFGTLLPDSLDAILGHWWQQIFTHIEARDPLNGDVTVWGLWRDPKSLRSVTSVSGSGATYRGKRIPDLRVRIRSNDEWAYLEDLDARFPTGRVRGSIGWRQGIVEGAYRAMVIDFESRAEWDAVVAASGLGILERLRFSGEPLTRARGVLWTGPKGAPPEAWQSIPDLTVELLDNRGQSVVGGLPLNNLRMTGTIRGPLVDLDNISGGFAEGVFTGSLRIRDWHRPDDQKRQLRVQLFDADYVKALTELTIFMPDPGAAREALIREHTHGRVDADLDLDIRSQPRESRGSGQITLRDASISRIHLFGGLSRTLDELGLGFSSLNLNAASIDWQLEGHLLKIPECIITGPVVSLDARGLVNLESRLIRMDADLLLLQGLLSRVLSPVSNNFQFTVTGPLKNPSWNLRLNPLGIFRSPNPSGNSEGGSL